MREGEKRTKIPRFIKGKKKEKEDRLKESVAGKEKSLHFPREGVLRKNRDGKV